MYIRPVHAELDLPPLHTFIQTHPLGLITTAIPHPTHAIIQTSHVPFVLDPSPSDAQATGKGVLRGHMARANPQVQAMIHSLTARDTTTTEAEMEERKSYAQAIPASTIDPNFSVHSTSTASTEALLPESSSSPSFQAGIENAYPSAPSYLTDEVLILFQSPHHSYVTPKFYTTTKPQTGKVVPTWNYAAVQIYGRLRLYHLPDPTTSAFLTKQITDLTVQQERLAGHGDELWEVGDAPESYVEMLKKGIVGMEIEILRCEGRFKLSQEMGEGDWGGVVQGFEGLRTEEGRCLAGMVRSAGEKVGKRAGDGVQKEGKQEEQEEEVQTREASEGGSVSWGGRLLGLVGLGKAR